MRYVLLDDEERALNLLNIMLRRIDLIQEDDEISSFSDAQDALEHIRKEGTDILFLDIEMPEINGLAFADTLRAEMDEPPEIIFVTAYPEYALEAWDTGAVGYILKPYSSQQIKTVLERTLKRIPGNNVPHEKKEVAEPKKQLPHMRCFPDFEMIVDGRPVSFKSKKSKELLALLVHHRGSWVSVDKVVFNLLENADEKSSKNYSRTLVYRLNQTLSSLGLADILISEYGQLRVDTSKFTCDYYDYLDGRTELFQGEYLEEYSWAENTKALMWDKMKK